MPVDEIIVVDNNCTDRTAEIARELGATVIRETRQNISASRNAGIRHARNDWIALLDHDDLWEPDKIRHQLNLLDLYPQTLIVGGQIVARVEEGRSREEPLIVPLSPAERQAETLYEYHPHVDIGFFTNHALHTSGLLIHRSLFTEYGFYDERFPPQEDVEFICRVLVHARVGYVNAPLLQYRRHDTNTTKTSPDVAKAHKLIVEEIHRYPAKYLRGAKERLAAALKESFVNQNRLLAAKLKKDTKG